MKFLKYLAKLTIIANMLFLVNLSTVVKTRFLHQSKRQFEGKCIKFNKNDKKGDSNYYNPNNSNYDLILQKINVNDNDLSLYAERKNLKNVYLNVYKSENNYVYLRADILNLKGIVKHNIKKIYYIPFIANVHFIIYELNSEDIFYKLNITHFKRYTKRSLKTINDLKTKNKDINLAKSYFDTSIIKEHNSLLNFFYKSLIKNLKNNIISLFMSKVDNIC